VLPAGRPAAPGPGCLAVLLLLLLLLRGALQPPSHGTPPMEEPHGSPKQSVEDWLSQTEVHAPGFTRALHRRGIRDVGGLVDAVSDESGSAADRARFDGLLAVASPGGRAVSSAGQQAMLWGAISGMSPFRSAGGSKRAPIPPAASASSAPNSSSRSSPAPVLAGRGRRRKPPALSISVGPAAEATSDVTGAPPGGSGGSGGAQAAPDKHWRHASELVPMLVLLEHRISSQVGGGGGGGVASSMSSAFAGPL
jgi:hypothetical protein